MDASLFQIHPAAAEPIYRQMVEQARRALMEKSSEPAVLETIARNLGVSYSTLRRLFREHPRSALEVRAADGDGGGGAPLAARGKDPRLLGRLRPGAGRTRDGPGGEDGA